MLDRAVCNAEPVSIRRTDAAQPAPAVPDAAPVTLRRSSDALDRALADAVASRPVIDPSERVSHVASPVLQRYVVKAALAEKPAPQFEAQQRQPGWIDLFGMRATANNGSFRDATGAVVVTPGPTGTQLRVSEDGKMAVEDTDLGFRQPKVFYAAGGVVSSSNAKLRARNSEYELYEAQVGAIRVDDQAGTKTRKLNKIMARRRVTKVALPSALHPKGTKGTKLKAKHRTADDEGLGLTVANVCGSVANSIVRQDVATVVPALKLALGMTSQGYAEYKAARAFVDLVVSLAQAQANVNAPTIGAEDQIAQAYMGLMVHQPVQAATIAQLLGVNAFADPTVGQAFGSITLGSAQGGTPDYNVLNPAHAQLRQTLIDTPHTPSGKTRDIWGTHYGAVVATSAGNKVTFENYARTHEEGALGSGTDPIYYFQMYGPASNPAQTWHGQWTTGRNQVINPITLVFG